MRMMRIMSVITCSRTGEIIKAAPHKNCRSMSHVLESDENLLKNSYT